MTRPVVGLALVALLAAGCRSSSLTDFRLDVVNQSQVAIVVSVVSDSSAVMQGFIPGDRGTLTIPLGVPANGFVVEVFRAADCVSLVEGTQTFPTPNPLTLIVEGGPGPGTGVLSVQGQVADVPIPLPKNDLRCPGG